MTTKSELCQAIIELANRGYDAALRALPPIDRRCGVPVREYTAEECNAALIAAGCTQAEIDDLDFCNAR